MKKFCPKYSAIHGVGLVQLLTQVGCYGPDTRARISPVDQIFTHFPIEEKLEAEKGRFGEEAMRLGKIFESITQYSDELMVIKHRSSGGFMAQSDFLMDCAPRPIIYAIFFQVLLGMLQ